MFDEPPRRPRSAHYHSIGCLVLLLALSLVCLMPLLLVDAMSFALAQLDLRPATATLLVLGMFIGGLINLPVARVERDEEQVEDWMNYWDLWGIYRRVRPVRRVTVIAVNLGGCVIPLLLAVWQIGRVAEQGGAVLTALYAAAGTNVVLCFLVARPVNGVGIVMPAWASPVAAIGVTCLLLADGQYAAWRAPVAFSAGVLGPLVGADLLHLKDLWRISAGMLSIGGAGTFDGIVLSGVGAAFVCGLLR